MGNSSSQPQNKTGKKVVAQKLENAAKTGVLSLSEHKLDGIPNQVFQLKSLRTLDLSKNNLKQLDTRLSHLTDLKIFICDDNKLPAGSLVPITKLFKLQNLSAGGNQLGKPVLQNKEHHSPKMPQPTPLPELPSSLKQLKLDANFFSFVPAPILSVKLTKLEKLDLSRNNLAAIPAELCTNLKKLQDLNLDNNAIVSLPNEIGTMQKLKVLSLKNNNINVSSTIFSTKNPQPIPKTLFTDTPIIDLNLHGNQMTSTQLNEFDGYSDFLKRREKIKSTALYGGALTNHSVCGLE